MEQPTSPEISPLIANYGRDHAVDSDVAITANEYLADADGNVHVAAMDALRGARFFAGKENPNAGYHRAAANLLTNLSARNDLLPITLNAWPDTARRVSADGRKNKSLSPVEHLAAATEHKTVAENLSRLSGGSQSLKEIDHHKRMADWHVSQAGIKSQVSAMTQEHKQQNGLSAGTGKDSNLPGDLKGTPITDGLDRRKRQPQDGLATGTGVPNRQGEPVIHRSVVVLKGSQNAAPFDFDRETQKAERLSTEANSKYYPMAHKLAGEAHIALSREHERAGKDSSRKGKDEEGPSGHFGKAEKHYAIGSRHMNTYLQSVKTSPTPFPSSSGGFRHTRNAKVQVLQTNSVQDQVSLAVRRANTLTKVAKRNSTRHNHQRAFEAHSDAAAAHMKCRSLSGATFHQAQANRHYKLSGSIERIKAGMSHPDFLEERPPLRNATSSVSFGTMFGGDDNSGGMVGGRGKNKRGGDPNCIGGPNCLCASCRAKKDNPRTRFMNKFTSNSRVHVLKTNSAMDQLRGASGNPGVKDPVRKVPNSRDNARQPGGAPTTRRGKSSAKAGEELGGYDPVKQAMEAKALADKNASEATQRADQVTAINDAANMRKVAIEATRTAAKYKSTSAQGRDAHRQAAFAHGDAHKAYKKLMGSSMSVAGLKDRANAARMADEHEAAMDRHGSLSKGLPDPHDVFAPSLHAGSGKGKQKANVGGDRRGRVVAGPNKTGKIVKNSYREPEELSRKADAGNDPDAHRAAAYAHMRAGHLAGAETAEGKEHYRISAGHLKKAAAAHQVGRTLPTKNSAGRIPVLMSNEEILNKRNAMLDANKPNPSATTEKNQGDFMDGTLDDEGTRAAKAKRQIIKNSGGKMSPESKKAFDLSSAATDASLAVLKRGLSRKQLANTHGKAASAHMAAMVAHHNTSVTSTDPVAKKVHAEQADWHREHAAYHNTEQVAGWPERLSVREERRQSLPVKNTGRAPVKVLTTNLAWLGGYAGEPNPPVETVSEVLPIPTLNFNRNSGWNPRPLGRL